MIVLCLSIILVIVLFLYLREHRNMRKIKKEYQYINSRICDILKLDENDYILVTTDIPVVKETTVVMNNLLEKFYVIQTDYNRSHKSILQLFTNISHDLRTPVTVLKGYIEMIYLQSQKEEMSTAMRETIEKTQSNSKELVHSVNNLFNMAKIQSGDLILNIQKTNLTQLCRELILEFYDLLDHAKFRVEVNIQDNPIFANVDTEALRRILKNLIDNSIKYGAEGKFLKISLYEKPVHAYIEIEDRGAGIPEEERIHIFTRAYTIDREKGNGLGLAICEGLANSMGACLSVSSVPHVKTVFTIKLNR